MAYPQQQAYHRPQYSNENYAVNPMKKERKPHVVLKQGSPIPTAVNDIVLKQAPNFHTLSHQSPQHNNANGYYPNQQQHQHPHHQQPQRRPYNNRKPPVITASHQKHIKQNKVHNQSHKRRSGSSSNHGISSSEEEFQEEELDENGQVVIIATDNSHQSKSNISYSNSHPSGRHSNEHIAHQPQPQPQPHPQQQYYANPPHQYQTPNNNYNEYNNAYNNGYPSNAYVPPYAYNNGQSYNNSQAYNGYQQQSQHPQHHAQPQRRPWVVHSHQPPPPLPKHKMQDYSTKATSKNGAYINNAVQPLPSQYQPPPAENHNLQYIDPDEDPHRRHKLSVATSVASSEARFATSFEQFDENILGDDDPGNTAEFTAIHYDQRFSHHASNALKVFATNANANSFPAQKPRNTSFSESNSLPQPAPATTPPSHGQQKKKKSARPRYKHPHPGSDASSRSNSAIKDRTGSRTGGGMNIMITNANTESFVEPDKPGTPSKSSLNGGSETRDSDCDLEILQRDKDYRPSVVEDLEHDDVTLNVTIDRFGFPMDETMDEKEHRKMVQKENKRLQKWQEMIFNKKLGGASAEEANETDVQIAHWNKVKNHPKLKKRIRKGVPQQLRGTVWQNLSGARERRKIECARYGSKNLYNDLRGRKKSKYHDQIWKDINRTYRKNLAFGASQLANASKNQNKSKITGRISNGGTQKFFKNVLQDPSKILTPQDLEKHATPAQIALYNVLKGFSLYRRDIGYCQGMQAVTALLLMYMTEEEAFWVLASLADDTKYQMDNLWRPCMPAIQLRFYQMERLVKITSPKLSQHFEKCGIISASMYQASQWFITIFLATDMKFSTITRVWDIYLNEGLKTVFRMGVGFLKYFEKQLLKSDFEEMLELFRTGGSQIDPDEYVKVCFQLRITHAQLAAFEKDFNRQQQQLKAQQKNI